MFSHLSSISTPLTCSWMLLDDAQMLSKSIDRTSMNMDQTERSNIVSPIKRDKEKATNRAPMNMEEREIS